MFNSTYYTASTGPTSTPHPPYLVLFAILALLALSTYFRPVTDQRSVYDIGGFQFLNTAAFFKRRYDFLQSHFKTTNQKIFQFRILHHQVVAISGEAARKVFFNNKDLDFEEGYKLLLGAAPRIEDININTNRTDDTPWINKMLHSVLRKDRLSDILPTFFDDLNKRMVVWGDEGRIDPFNDIYLLVFQLTVRWASCRELADDVQTVTQLSNFYLDAAKGATPLALMLPWLPSPSRKAKDAATQRLYTIVSKYVDMRKKATSPSSDTIDLLISGGNDDAAVIHFVLTVIFTGVINTGATACWVLLHLCASPKWKQKVMSEIDALISTYTDSTSCEPLYKRLATVPITALEEELPSLDLVIREVLRLTLNGTMFRRNVVDDLVVGDKVVHKGAFMAYALPDIHLNSNIYPDPYEFDPDRFTEGREEDKKEAFSYMAWGGGRHPCTGIKVAKLEIKMITALFLASYEYKLVDAFGNHPIPFPQLDRNDIQQARPLGEPCFLAYKRVVR